MDGFSQKRTRVYRVGGLVKNVMIFNALTLWMTPIESSSQQYTIESSLEQNTTESSSCCRGQFRGSREQGNIGKFKKLDLSRD